MKLSEKGKNEFVALAVSWKEGLIDEQDIELEPDDFENCVVLTISRAKEVAKKLNDVGIQHEQDFGDFDYDALDLADCLNELIEKAEGTE